MHVRLEPQCSICSRIKLLRLSWPVVETRCGLHNVLQPQGRSGKSNQAFEAALARGQNRVVAAFSVCRRGGASSLQFGG